MAAGARPQERLVPPYTPPHLPLISLTSPHIFLASPLHRSAAAWGARWRLGGALRTWVAWPTRTLTLTQPLTLTLPLPLTPNPNPDPEQVAWLARRGEARFVRSKLALITTLGLRRRALPPLYLPYISLYLPYISPISPYISPIYPLHLPYISPTSPLHLPHISPASPLHLGLRRRALAVWVREVREARGAR